MQKKRRFDFTKKNKRSGKVENVGYLNLEQDEEQSRCSLYFYGDIVSATWESMWYEEDRCPQDIADFLNQLDGYEDIDIYFNSGGRFPCQELSPLKSLVTRTGFEPMLTA